MKRIADNSRNIHLTFLNVERLFDLIPIYSILLCIMLDLCFHHLYFILLHPLDPQTAGYAVSTKILFNLVGSEKLTVAGNRFHVISERFHRYQIWPTQPSLPKYNELQIDNRHQIRCGLKFQNFRRLQKNYNFTNLERCLAKSSWCPMHKWKDAEI